MLDVRVDESISPRPKRRPAAGSRTWLIRAGFMAAHLAMIGVALAWIGVWQPFSGSGRAGATPPSGVRPSPPLPAPTLAMPPRPFVVAPPPMPGPRPVPVVRPDPPAPGPVPQVRPTPKPATLEERREGPSEKVRPLAPEEVLRENGLERSGRFFVLPAEAEAQPIPARLDATAREGQGVANRIAAIQQIDAEIDWLRRHRFLVDDEIRIRDHWLATNPHGGNNILRGAYETIRRERIHCAEELRILDREVGDLNLSRPGPAERQELDRSKNRLEAKYREDVLELRRLVDSATARYEELAKSEGVQAALRQIEKDRGAAMLGPSDRFRGIIQDLIRAEKFLKEG